MRKLIFVVIACLMSTAFSFSAEAQVLNRLKKRAKEAAERKAEEKLAQQVEQMAAQMVEESWNSIFGEMSGDSANWTIPFRMNSHVITEDSYSFDTITSMKVETIRKDGKPEPPVLMDMHFNKEALYTGTKFDSENMKEEGDLFIIYDFKNSAMLMLMSNKDEKFSFAYDWEQALEEAQQYADDENDEEVNWEQVEEWRGYQRIGNKTILGYDCDGYRTENEDKTIEVWITRDADFGMQRLFRANANTKHMRGKIPDTYPMGTMMELTSVDLESGDKTVMEITEINKKANVSYIMADYPTMSFSPKSAN